MTSSRSIVLGAFAREFEAPSETSTSSLAVGGRANLALPPRFAVEEPRLQLALFVLGGISPGREVAIVEYVVTPAREQGLQKLERSQHGCTSLVVRPD